MITFRLSEEDARFLHQQLERHVHEMQGELVHTDTAEFRRALRAESARLRTITKSIAAAMRKQHDHPPASSS